MSSGSRKTVGAFPMSHSIARALPAISANSRLGSLARMSVAIHVRIREESESGEDRDAHDRKQRPSFARSLSFH
jgi:hypothetical protein